MNLPLSEIIEQGSKTTEFDYKTKLNSYLGDDFSGYLVATIDGFEGFEEGVLIIRKGLVVSAIYEFLNYNLTVFGDSALKHIFNSFLSDKGIVDTYSLTTQQVDLVIAFNDKIKLVKPMGKVDVVKIYPSKFSPELSRDLLKEVISKEDSREAVLKKFGLGTMG